MRGGQRGFVVGASPSVAMAAATSPSSHYPPYGDGLGPRIDPSSGTGAGKTRDGAMIVKRRKVASVPLLVFGVRLG